MTSRLHGQLVTLETLKLSAYEDYQSFPWSMSPQNSTQVKIFLSSLKLRRLCRLGFMTKFSYRPSNPVGPLFDIFASTFEKMPGICDWSLDHYTPHCYVLPRISKPCDPHVRYLNGLDWTFVGPTLSMRNRTTPPGPQIAPAPEPHQTFHFSPLLAKIPRSGTYASSCIMSSGILGPCPPSL